MISRPTVLVLGAGASAPFGFPTGLRLSERIVRDLQVGHPGYNALQEYCGFDETEITRFRLAFFRSGRNSVDAFLEHREDLLGVGKAAIAVGLIGFENEGRLFAYDDANWLRDTYNYLNVSPD